MNDEPDVSPEQSTDFVVETSPAEQAPIDLAATPKFCRSCGAVWALEWVECQSCPRRLSPVEQPIDGLPTLRASGWMYAVLLLLSAAVLIYAMNASEITAFQDLTISFASAAVVVPALIWYRARLSTYLSIGNERRWYVLAPPIAIGSAAFAMLLVHFASKLTGGEVIEYSDRYFIEGYSFLWPVLATAVIPAVFEEFAFRGIIFDGLSRHLTRSETILVSAGLFTILHLSIVSIPFLFLLGWLLGTMRAHTNSLLPGMLLHFSHNFIVVALEWREYSKW